MRARTPGRIGLGDDLIANVVYTGSGDKPKLQRISVQRSGSGPQNNQALAGSSRRKCRGSLALRRKTRASFRAGVSIIDSGLLRSERYRSANFRKTAIAIPSAKASATKYQRVGKPRTKISALPAAKRSPIKPPPKVILCMVMPGWRFSDIGHLVGVIFSPAEGRRKEGLPVGARDTADSSSGYRRFRNDNGLIDRH